MFKWLRRIEDSLTADLSQYDPRNIKRADTFSSARSHAGPSRQPKLVMGAAASAQSQTFGQRLNGATSKSSAARGKSAVDASVLSTRRNADGGMEMSFIPSGKARRDDADEQDEYSGGTKRAERSKKIERFGAGMEKGQMDEEETSGRGGRSQRRHVGRSASKNAFRKR